MSEQNHENEIPAGIYRARGIEGSDQLGRSNNGNQQVAIDVELVESKRRLTVFMSFTDAAAPFSLERLRALGWPGGDSFAGIDKNEVQVEVKYEMYQGNRKMKVDILTGGRFVMKDPLNDTEKRAFFAGLNKLASAPAPQAGQGYPADWDKAAPAAAPTGAKPRVSFT